MSKRVYMLLLGLTLPLAYATSQTGNSTSTTNPTAGQSKPATGSTETQAVTSEAASSSEMQTQIQNALRNEPMLANDAVTVAVSDDEISVSGTVASAKEKLTAERIVQSYAGNRKVKNHLKVGARGQDNLSDSNQNTQNPARNPDQNKNTSSSSSKPPNK